MLGAILHLKGLNGEATRENIKELFDNFASVRYIDYNKGLVEAYVRFGEENKAAEVLEKARAAGNGEVSLRGANLEVRVLAGDEEEEYWRQVVRKLAEARGRRKNAGGGGGRKQRGGGRGGSNPRKRGRDDGDADENDEEGGGDHDNSHGNGVNDGDGNDSSVKKVKADAEATDE